MQNNHDKDVNAHYRLIDADKVDGFHAGNEENNVPASNGNINSMLNADLIDGHHAGNSGNEVLVLDENGIVPENNLIPYAIQHTHPVTNILTNKSIHSFDNMQIVSGYNVGKTTYVYPPDYYIMKDLLAFIPSIRVIYYSGDVDGNDSLYCTWTTEATRIKIICYNSEQRANPQVNWLDFWRKNRPAKYI